MLGARIVFLVPVDWEGEDDHRSSIIDHRALLSSRQSYVVPLRQSNEDQLVVHGQLTPPFRTVVEANGCLDDLKI